MGGDDDAGRPDGLLDGETVIALTRVRFSPGLPATVETADTVSMHRPTIVQRHAYAKWARIADGVGFPIAGPEMILGVTQDRLIVWRPAMLRNRPGRFAGAIPLSRVRKAGVHRRVFVSVLTFLLDGTAIVGVETTRGARLRRFAEAIPTYIGRKDR